MNTRLTAKIKTFATEIKEESGKKGFNMDYLIQRLCTK